MDVPYAFGLLAALLVGGAGGWLGTFGYFAWRAAQERAYEKQLAEEEDIYLARDLLRRMNPDQAAEDE
jgi:hypothetical protein